MISYLPYPAPGIIPSVSGPNCRYSTLGMYSPVHPTPPGIRPSLLPLIRTLLIDPFLPRYPYSGIRPPVLSIRPMVLSIRPPVLNIRPTVLSILPPVLSIRPPVLSIRPLVLSIRPSVSSFSIYISLLFFPQRLTCRSVVSPASGCDIRSGVSCSGLSFQMLRCRMRSWQSCVRLWRLGTPDRVRHGICMAEDQGVGVRP